MAYNLDQFTGAGRALPARVVSPRAERQTATPGHRRAVVNNLGSCASPANYDETISCVSGVRATTNVYPTVGVHIGVHIERNGMGRVVTPRNAKSLKRLAG